MQSQDLETIIYEKDGPVARIVLKTPEKANMQSVQQVADMESCLDWAEADDDVKVLILKANGKGFCAGHAIVDREEMAQVYPLTGHTPESTWTKHNYDLMLWAPLRLWEGAVKRPLQQPQHRPLRGCANRGPSGGARSSPQPRSGPGRR